MDPEIYKALISTFTGAIIAFLTSSLNFIFLRRNENKRIEKMYENEMKKIDLVQQKEIDKTKCSYELAHQNELSKRRLDLIEKRLKEFYNPIYLLFHEKLVILAEYKESHNIYQDLDVLTDDTQ